MNRLTKRSTTLDWLSTATAVLMTSAPAVAQDATVGVGATTTIPSRNRAVETGEGRAEGRSAAVAAAGSSAHDAVVGHLGVGWFGTRDVPVGPANGATTGAVPTPIVGIRYWLTSAFGVDAGLGFFTMSSALRNEAGTATTTEGPTRTTVLIHAAVPISLAEAGNFSFLVIPELNVGLGMGGVKASMGNASTDLSGFLIEGGLRAGAEVFFGFIGIPQLSLEGTVGAFFSSSSGKVSQGGGSTRFSTFVFSTSSVAQPWDIFRKDIAARYYF
jgi:hypothetical protein